MTLQLLKQLGFLRLSLSFLQLILPTFSYSFRNLVCISDDKWVTKWHQFVGHLSQMPVHPVLGQTIFSRSRKRLIKAVSQKPIKEVH